jgi:hypothetical protein
MRSVATPLRLPVVAEASSPITMTHRPMTAELLTRYLLAAQVVKGRTVVDAGCGGGEGARILAEGGADRVIGVHVGDGPLPDALRGRSEGRFLAGEAARLGLGDGVADVVVGLDLLEAVDDAEPVLDELRRVLAPDGLLIVSCPTRGAAPGSAASRLTRALGRRFRRVGLLSQHGGAASIVCEDPRAFGTGAWAEAGAVVRTGAPLAPEDQTHALLLASDAALPALQAVVVLDEGAETRAGQDRLAALGREMDEARAAAARLRAAEARLQARVRTLGEQLLEAERASARLVAVELAAERHAAEVERLMARLAEAEQRAEAVQQRAAALEQHAVALEQHAADVAQRAAADVEQWRLEASKAYAGLEQARGEAAGAVATQQRLEARLHYAQTEVLALRTSTSWMLTAPLRAIGRGLRRLAGRRSD